MTNATTGIFSGSKNFKEVEKRLVRGSKLLRIGRHPFLACIASIVCLQLTSSPSCWRTINRRILMSFIVPVIQHGRQGLCYLNLSGMVANHLLTVALAPVSLQDKQLSEDSELLWYYTALHILPEQKNGKITKDQHCRHFSISVKPSCPFIKKDQDREREDGVTKS